MRAVILSALAAVVALSCVACNGGMQQTALPGVESQPGAQAPASSAGPETSDTSSDGSDDQPDEPPVTSGRPAMSRPGASTPRASAPAGHSPSPRPPARPAFRNACAHAASPGRRQCDSLVRLQAHRPCSKSAPYCASDLQSAYGAAQAARNRGRGVLVAIVGAYGYPSAASDLAVYRKSMGLSACTAGSGCLKIVNQTGHTSPLPKPNADASDDWRAEEAVDVQMVSALCPNCRLLLVQANSDKDADLAAGVNAAVALGATAISNSYGSDETNAADAAYAHAGRTITASAGDGTANQPCSFAGVVCVGGTTLNAASGRWTERAWRSGGSACSAYVAKPSWQRARGCAMRSVADVSAVGDPSTGVAFYESAGGGWQQAGGTGVSAPIVAALFALEPSSVRANAPAWLWRHGRKPPKLGGS
ncbi:MAG TPA: peptidase S8 [Candidatus Binatia bacterium]|nr:peptidase S8 [Candidatus Binatia bacterium]